MEDQALLITEAAVLEPKPSFRTLSWTIRSRQLHLMKLIRYLWPVALDRETHSPVPFSVWILLGSVTSSHPGLSRVR